VLGIIMLASGILGLAIDSAAVGLVTAAVCVLAYLAIHRRPGHMLPKRVSGH
jgi:biopolymer transport protein ExbB/TolQ